MEFQEIQYWEESIWEGILYFKGKLAGIESEGRSFMNFLHQGFIKRVKRFAQTGLV